MYGCDRIRISGHLSEMINEEISAEIDSISIPVIRGAIHCAEEFLLTAAAQRNRNHVGDRVEFSSWIPFSMKSSFYSQTSGGLLFAVKPEQVIFKRITRCGTSGGNGRQVRIQKRKRHYVTEEKNER